ncbi:MAG: T9SS type A sorting domain-containing protein [Candidatus Latescibacteria bacterium]|nr:T9SS type A sorting domain-containing protein [bacterium]MBD3424121.1 T9SS type A sorting domain-containing protein [Candidatus Latescibacterota bacterium]
MKNLKVKNLRWVLLLIGLLLMVVHPSMAQTYPIKVALYDDDGTGPSKEDLADALADTTLFDVTRVLGADIRAGILDGFDVLIHPGGSASAQASSLQEAGRDSVRAFVARGGAYAGVCAGSYLATCDYSWSLDILNARVINKDPWARGAGDADVRFNEFGQDLFSLGADTVVIYYASGALMAPAGIDTLPPYLEVGVFETDIAEYGAPPGVMIGTTAFNVGFFGNGRLGVFSPHPELTPGYEYMWTDLVEWLADDDPFLAVTSPRELEIWEEGNTETIKWISSQEGESVDIEFSDDNGVSWTTVATGQTGPYVWTVAAPTTEGIIRATSTIDGSVTYSSRFTIVPPPDVYTSVATGNWSDPVSWDQGAVPDLEDNVIIGSGHIVTVDTEARCHDLSFTDNTGRLAMEADLSLYGDFYRFDTSTNHFYSGGNLWQAGARMIFKGDAPIQTIHNLGTSSTSPYPFRLQEVVIDKPLGKFMTNPDEETDADFKLGIGTSLEVVSGIFELGRRDDVEGRTTWGSASTPTITVHAGAYFRMQGSYSHVRRGTYLGEEDSKIGKLTVYGHAVIASSSSNRMNLGGIDVEDGGLVEVPYYSRGGNMGTARFNPGTITIKDGGTFQNSLITDYWYDNLTTPTQVALLDGGTFKTKSSSTSMPAFSTNQGTIQYARDGSDQNVVDMDYHSLLISYGSGSSKIWNLGGNRTVADQLRVNYSADLVITGAAPESLTVESSLRLVSGSLDNSDPDIALVMADGSLIKRYWAPITTAPVFAGLVDLEYRSSGHSVTTGPELPTAAGVLNRLQVWSTGQTVTLDADAQINSRLTLSNGVLDNSGATLTMADGAQIQRGAGSITAIPTFAGNVNVDYISTITTVTTGPEMPAGTEILTDLTVSGSRGVILGEDVRVNGTCTISGSELETDSYTLTLGPAATLVESGGLTVIGTVTTTRNASQSVNESFGEIGLEVNAGCIAPGVTSVTRVTGTALDIAGSSGIKRYFEISPANNIGLDATVVAHYDESELSGISESVLEAYSRYDSGGDWFAGGAVVDEVANTVTATGLNSLGTLTFGSNGIVTDVEGQGKGLPEATRLVSVYPNPFNPATRIKFELSRRSPVRIVIYDVSGRAVRTLKDRVMDPGRHELTWNGINSTGRNVSSGVYFCRMVTDGTSQTLKMVLLR